jgi:hypothetical protein
MSAGEFARVRDAGRESLPTARPVFGPPHHDEPHMSDPPGGMMAPDKSTRAWEATYRQYGRAWEWTARSQKGDPAAAREMASASWAVAAAWRQIAATTTLPWWALAAIESAAAAFEAQAREYETRKGNDGHAVDETAKQRSVDQ